MTNKNTLAAMKLISLWAFSAATPVNAQQNQMSFFVTSVGLGKGGDLGGLEGADRQCQSLAQAAGAGSRTWHAYLSTQGAGGVNAKDRIGSGPWSNAKGVQIASNVAEWYACSSSPLDPHVRGSSPHAQLERTLDNSEMRVDLKGACLHA